MPSFLFFPRSPDYKKSNPSLSPAYELFWRGFFIKKLFFPAVLWFLIPSASTVPGSVMWKAEQISVIIECILLITNFFYLFSKNNVEMIIAFTEINVIHKNQHLNYLLFSSE